MACILWLRLEPGRKFRPSPPLDFWLNQYSQMSIRAKPKKRRGRPATGRDPMMGFRAPPVLRAAIVKWAENQPDQPTLSEATRRLVEQTLSISTRAKQPSPAHATRAKELAKTAIDKMSDGTAHPEEQAQRRQRLTKGPLEFREGRIDQPKAKPK